MNFLRKLSVSSKGVEKGKEPKREGIYDSIDDLKLDTSIHKGNCVCWNIFYYNDYLHCNLGQAFFYLFRVIGQGQFLVKV